MPGLNLEAWLIELRDDPDKDFLLAGITHGFDIVNSEALVVPVEVKIIRRLHQGVNVMNW